MNLFNESKDNGWIPIRRNLLPHLADGRLTTSEYITLIYLLLTVGSSTGETQTCAPTIADAHRWQGDQGERKAQRALKGLKEKGYIEVEGSLQGRRGLYKVRVLKFERSTGPQKGIKTAPSMSVTCRQRDGDEVGDVTVTPSLTMSVSKTAQATDITDGYKPSLTDTGGDDVGDDVGDMTVTCRQRDGDGAAIQERHSNNETEKEEGVSERLASSDSSAPGQESPELRLTRLLFRHLGEPAKFKGKGFGPAWTKKFRALLRDESFETIRDVMEWGYEIDSFWPKHLMRTDRDPLEFFLSKFADLKSRAAGELKARRNQAKQETPAGKTEKQYPRLHVCDNDPIADELARMRGEAR